MRPMRIGFEIHQQLDTHKLFCSCPSWLRDDKPDVSIGRRLRPTQSELGEIDKAALEEFLKGKSFDYDIYSDSICLVEADEEPPHNPNEEAIDIALEIAMLMKANIVEEIHFMRKLVIDGSNTSGFQRTAIIAMDGKLETERGIVKVPTICLEEEAARKVSEKGMRTRYKLDRLGIPLIEITTAPDITSPGQAREVAMKIGEVLRSTKKVKRGIGTIRQDINISIEGGGRVEIKGVQDLNLIPKIIEKEVKRQERLMATKGEVPAETRTLFIDASTKYMRPLPGAARMYPETDIAPIVITEERLDRIRSSLPELLDEKIERFTKKYELSKELSTQIVKSENVDLFEEIVDMEEFVDAPSVVASILTGTLKEIEREGKKIVITNEGFEEIFRFASKKKLAHGAIKEVVKEVNDAISKNPEEDVVNIIEGLGLKSIDDKGLKAIINKVLEDNKDLIKEKGSRAAKPLMGLVMKEVRGRADGKLINEILQGELKKVLGA